MKQITVPQLEAYIRQDPNRMNGVFWVSFDSTPTLCCTFRRGVQDQLVCVDYGQLTLPVSDPETPLSVVIQMAELQAGTRPALTVGKPIGECVGSFDLPVFIGTESELSDQLRQPEVSECLCLMVPSKPVIQIPCRNGILTAEAGGDPAFPEIFTYLVNENGLQIDLVAVGADLPGQENGPHGGGIHAYLWGNPKQEDWTRKYLFTEKELSE